MRGGVTAGYTCPRVVGGDTERKDRCPCKLESIKDGEMAFK